MSNIPPELLEAIWEDARGNLQRINLRYLGGEHKDIDTLAEEISSVIYDTAQEHLFVAREEEDI